MYSGWLSFAGTELVNVARLQTYADLMLPTLQLRACEQCFDLATAVEDDPYIDPITDEAPWYDPDTLGSDEFLGILPSGMTGFEDSTAQATVIQSSMDGGAIGKPRRAAREMRVSAVLFGASQIGAQAGLTWLKNAVDGNLCNTCDDSDDICFFTACPRPGESPDSLIRHIRRVKRVSGPIILSERELACGGYIIEVEFQFVAGSPYVYGEPIAVASAAGATLTPILPGTEVFSLSVPIETCYAVLDKPNVNVLRDPDCPVVPNAPTVPTLSNACKPLTFSTYAYYPTQARVTVKSGNYNARPVVARGPVWFTAYTTPTRGIDAATVIKAKTSTTSGSSWSSEYTLYDEGSGTRGLETAGVTWAPDAGKFILGANNWNLAATDGTFARHRGEILTSSTGLSGSWTVVANLDTVMTKYGMRWYRLSDVEHHENGTANGVTYAVVWGVRKNQTEIVTVLLRSYDVGVTWSVVGIPWFENPNNSYTYSTLAVWPNGEIGVLANIPEARSIYFKRSADGGKSWAAGTVVATAASGIPNPVITNDGGIMVMYRDMRNPGPRGLGRHGYWYSKNRGRNWYPGSGTLFAKGDTHGQQGADWAVGATGDLGVVYALDYTATDARVYWTTFWQKENFLSYAIAVPDNALEAWKTGVLLLQIRTGAKATRQIRVRLVPRPLADQAPEDLDPCSICSSFIIDYAPANTVIYFDGMSERVTMKVGSSIALPADHLVSGENGQVFQWPQFNCGTGYFILLDIDVATLADVAVAVANRE